MIQVLFTELNKPLSEDSYRFHLNGLPIPIRRKIENLQRKEDAQNSLVGKILLRIGLNSYAPHPKYAQSSQVQEEQFSDILNRLEYTLYNRPYLPGTDIDFNISHSGHMVTCVIAQNCHVGIDVEQIQPVDFSEFQDQFTSLEIERIKKSMNKERKFWFYWTIKEAVVKAQGVGLEIPLTKITIHQDETLANVFSRTWFLQPLDLHNGYCGCMATDQSFDGSRIKMEYISPDSLETFCRTSLIHHGV
jgi:4'-phosphopantetheinyl transferase